MIGKGARNLILLSRSGASSKAASEELAVMKRQGVNVLAPPCDVSSSAALSAVLEKSRLMMPPIRGCINGSGAWRSGRRLPDPGTFTDCCLQTSTSS
ncbi:hypothetical protein GGR56DRAFT_661740 [Xylariaceae sp. FL0804]|nr:hypothetical protein GGR56DRAFT_661740 [Xylariaceae sp. FL0804]